MHTRQYIAWARELAALSQTGLTFSQIEYDRERYTRMGAIAAEMLAAASDVPLETVRGWHAAEFGYATPKVDVRGVVFREDKLLLVREIMDAGRWTLPGGWADVNDAPSDAVLREIREESGFESRIVRLLAVLDREKQGHEPPFPFHIYKLFFQCEITGGEATPNHEADEIAFFGVDELPELSVSRVTKAQIVHFFRVAEEAGAPVWFD
ncbi:MAG: NUDIX hydrolase N-terminal domain-containing protein [Candidatus Hydrogenedentes bacterium]|nr:NUDIX hydrolase N-terminal domain-containing protein [Candidatus Hydrogenedentota bacterium]